MRVYLDVFTFNRLFDDQNQLKIKLETEAKLFIQQSIINGIYELVWSYILEYENNKNKLMIDGIPLMIGKKYPRYIVLRMMRLLNMQKI